MRKRQILLAGFLARMEDTRLPNVLRTGGGRGLRWRSGKRVDGVSPDDFRAFGINADQWTTAVRTRGNDARRQNGGPEPRYIGTNGHQGHEG